MEERLFQGNGHLVDMLCCSNQEITTSLRLKLDFTHKSSVLVEFQPRYNSPISAVPTDQDHKTLVLFKTSGDPSKTFIPNQKMEQ